MAMLTRTKSYEGNATIDSEPTLREAAVAAWRSSEGKNESSDAQARHPVAQSAKWTATYIVFPLCYA